MVVGSDAPAKNSQVGETAHAPPKGASSPRIESASELEESPTATDCTLLALVEAAPSQSTSLLAENQDCSVEPKGCHEGTCSAGLLAQNEFSSSSAIANQTQGQVEAGNLASLLVENSVSGGEIKTVDEGESSAASVPNSHSLGILIEWKLSSSRLMLHFLLFPLAGDTN